MEIVWGKNHVEGRMSKEKFRGVNRGWPGYSPGDILQDSATQTTLQGAKWIDTKGKAEHVNEVRERGRNTLSASHSPVAPSTVHNAHTALSGKGTHIPCLKLLPLHLHVHLSPLNPHHLCTSFFYFKNRFKWYTTK